MANLSHRASFHSKEKIAPSNCGIKQRFQMCRIDHHHIGFLRLPASSVMLVANTPIRLQHFQRL